MQTICMKCQSLFSGKTKKKIVSLSSDEFIVKVNADWILKTTKFNGITIYILK